MIRYYKLFDLLNRRGLKKSDLRTVVSSATIAKLSKHQFVRFDTLEKIACFLGCQIGDLWEYTPDMENRKENKENA